MESNQNIGSSMSPRIERTAKYQLELVEVWLQPAPGLTSLCYYDAANDVAVLLSAIGQMGLVKSDPRAIGFAGFVVAHTGKLTADAVQDYMLSAMHKCNLQHLNTNKSGTNEYTACHATSAKAKHMDGDLTREHFPTLISFRTSDEHLNNISMSLSLTVSALTAIDDEELNKRSQQQGDSGAPSVH